MPSSLFRPGRRAVLAAFVALPALGLVPAIAQDATPETWIIEPAEARALIADGAIVLDMRSKDLREETPIDGAVVAAWQDFSQADRASRGNLIEDAADLTERLQKIGISQEVPVVALGTPLKGWGEDGRLVWTLRVSGHERAYVVNGGADAVLAEGPLAIAPVAAPGDFVAQHNPAFEATLEEVKAALGQPDVVILDTREAREYQGETPYGESRKGHIPGAKHLYFRDILDDDGRILDSERLQAVLTANGITPSSQVISYCTAGIRSAYMTAVLRDMGIDARNYDGSMAEWTAQPEAEFPMSLP